MQSARSLRHVPWLALPALVAALPVCGDEGGGAGGAGTEPPVYAQGVGGSTYADAAPQPSPFAEGGAGGGASQGGGPSIGGAPPCDESAGDPSACDDPGGCLTAALCDQVEGLLSPRTAGIATSCMATLAAGCSPLELAACFSFAAELACSAAPEGTPPCDVVATLCADGDPFGTLATCLSMASVLSEGAVSVLGPCLDAEAYCDPSSLETCVTALFQ